MTAEDYIVRAVSNINTFSDNKVVFHKVFGELSGWWGIYRNKVIIFRSSWYIREDDKEKREDVINMCFERGLQTIISAGILNETIYQVAKGNL